jgi:hypothetical protein
MGTKEIILGSAYLPYGDVELPPPRELENLVMELGREELT